MSKIEVDAITEQSGSTLTTGGGAGKTVVVDATTVTLGRCGGTVALASGASQTGFGRTGTVDWQTTPKTATFTAVNGEGYFINSGSAITANLPAGSPGAIVAFSDYARNFATYNLTVTPNGSEKIGGTAASAKLNIDGQASTFVYVDSTKGWINVQNAEDTESGAVEFMTATGGTITTVCTNFKVHTFTGPGTFAVSAISSVCASRNQVSYLVVGGGGGGGAGDVSGGGGGGGFREDKSPSTPYTASPLEGAGAITVTASSFPITVGAGGAHGPTPQGQGSNGVNSVFSTTTSAGGGGGGNGQPGGSRNGANGGSGGGSGYSGGSGGSGNTPPVSPPQGQNGATHPGPTASPAYGAGGGGGATATGSGGTPSAGGNGGAGATTNITGSPVPYAGGGGGARNDTGTVASGGTGGGGSGGNGGTTAGNGGANTGGGGGGSDEQEQSSGGVGGSGVVIIRYKFQ